MERRWPRLPLRALVASLETVAATQVDDVALWYHTIELAPGIVTPGWFDLRPVVQRMPWPDVRGKRCLDVGTYDGFLAFELERRGAGEVVAADIADHEQWDWPVRDRDRGPLELADMAGERKGQGFEVAKKALGSSVERMEISAYDLRPDRVGSFDFVVCGSLMLHLKNPVGALEAIRSVCTGSFLSAEQLSSRQLPWRRPAARFRGGDKLQWWIPNPAAHVRMVESAGFEIERVVRPYRIPFGEMNPAAGRLRSRGLLHGAVLARPQR